MQIFFCYFVPITVRFFRSITVRFFRLYIVARTTQPPYHPELSALFSPLRSSPRRRHYLCIYVSTSLHFSPFFASIRFSRPPRRAYVIALSCTPLFAGFLSFTGIRELHSKWSRASLLCHNAGTISRRASLPRFRWNANPASPGAIPADLLSKMYGVFNVLYAKIDLHFFRPTLSFPLFLFLFPNFTKNLRSTNVIWSINTDMTIKNPGREEKHLSSTFSTPNNDPRNFRSKINARASLKLIAE